ncbi:MAG: zinc ribbon domain-containing protein [Deltaproteobacteria bacterium]|nr:zinc ribbon domain-containing protein [Deltaproteobacteria bacterium]MBW2331949.1 zinc ribbon domain-containing protein [Deltaproteobacteria bacterium]RLB24958.1 MAG: zinc ribbon domain-containing protein [Deltaproteobacteria bacterium]HDH88308.1 zinc ribbon domain-containing protein [Desulfobacteraceae bacterium]
MPIYEYKCSKCGRITEMWQKFSDPPVSVCEICGGPVKKIISQNTFHLKGSGWYVTDYASGASKNRPAKKEDKEKKPKKDDTKNASKEVSKKAPSTDT